MSTVKNIAASISYCGSSGPLHLLIDSTGIKADGEGKWNARKHGDPKPRLWRKVYIGIDGETLERRAVEVTTSSIGDAPMLTDLLNQTPRRPELCPLQTVRLTRASAMLQLPPAMPLPASRQARMRRWLIQGLANGVRRNSFNGCLSFQFVMLQMLLG